MSGETLTATKDGGKVVLTDAAGGKATIVEGDQKRSNGVVHTIDAVLMPSARRRRLRRSKLPCSCLSLLPSAERSL